MIEDVIGGLIAAKTALGRDAQVHAHVDEDAVLLCVRDSDQVIEGIRADSMRACGWSYDADTGDWFIEIEEGCEE